MQKIVILFLILIGINSCKCTETSATEEKDEMEMAQKIGTLISISPENYYELLIADHMIELVLSITQNCSDIDHLTCEKKCYGDFKKITDTIDIDQSVYTSIINIYYQNPKELVKKNLCEALKNALPNPIVIKQGDYAQNSKYGYNGEYGPKGEKGPFGPYGSKGPFRTHKHKLWIYGKIKKLICRYIKGYLDFMEYLKINTDKIKFNNLRKNCGINQITQRRLDDAIIDLSAICEYVFGFFGFDTSNCEN